MSGAFAILLSCPKGDDKTYKKYYDEIVRFQARFCAAVRGCGSGDAAFVVADPRGVAALIDSGCPRESIVAADPLCRGESLPPLPDIWVRDYGPVPVGAWDRFVQFRFAPKYIAGKDSEYIRTKAETFFQRALPQGSVSKCPLKVDGGNVVRSPDLAVCVSTTRITENGPGAAEKLRKELGAAVVCVVDEEEGDVVGHSDGMAAFMSDKDVVINEGDSAVRKKVTAAVPGARTVEIPCNLSDVSTDGFPDASGIYTNLLATERGVYVPSYGDAGADAAVAAKLQPLLRGRQYVPVPLGRKVPLLGGSLRCLTWECGGETASHLIRVLSKCAVP
eukprot:TRINITY_DN47205_c0_g1_i1.p1 TRINITY_DN47205_c0_g1~~TRINITY_DN47205_c0_g1_i1.p1  ORF type:complete len:333 (+),score=104.81 TRINITY_DN47205_c0_g1_i1:66-1064(+)